MKNLLLVLLISLSGCAQLIQGQSQPVKAINEKQGIFFTTCSGAVEVWASCFTKAKDTCQTGYNIIEQNENANGGIRRLTFQCKK